MNFRAMLELGGKTATGIVVPADVVTALGAGKRPAVRVTLNGYPYRSTVAVMGGRYLVPVSAEHRVAAGVAAGDELEVTIELDTEVRTVEVPDDLARALDADPTVRAAFDALPVSQRKEHVRAIDEAKKAETRQRRVEKAVALVRSKLG